MPWTLVLDDYVPTSVNMLVGIHWYKGHRLKSEARDRVAVARLLSVGIPDAVGKRRVSVAILMAGPGRPIDPDNVWKCLADSLVANRLLMDDSARYLEMGPVTVSRGRKRSTVVILEDLP